jgi:hypothetical protein
MIGICPHCRKRYSYDPHNSEGIHECNSGDEYLDEEDVFVLGDWEDYTGSGTVSNSITMTAGLENEAQFTKAQITDDVKVQDLTKRGKRKATHRQRQKLTYIDGE